MKLLKAFFPIHILLAHLKYNLFSMLFWGILFMLVNDQLGYSFGVPLLFLSPEYLGEISFLSFLLIGFSFGGFAMAFNTYSYIKLGPHFPFLTSLSRPFFRFCINNAFIPLTFLIFFLIKVSIFQHQEEFASTGQIFSYLLATLVGMIAFFTLSMLYFFPIERRKNRIQSSKNTKPISSFIYRQKHWFDVYELEKDNIYFYLGRRLKIHQSRSIKHLDRSVIERTFAKNRVNASVFEVITISAFFLLGLFSGYDIMEVPAAMSILLLMTITIMLFSALQSWFKAWVYPLLIVVILGINALSRNTELFRYNSYIYGLSYDSSTNQEYSLKAIQQVSEDKEKIQSSFSSYINTLERWKEQTGEKRPKLVIINTTGGGSRSALWTLTVLQKTDAALNGRLTPNIQMITGASGGMVGAAYFREILLRSKKDPIINLYASKFSNNMSKDILNKLSFVAATNDIFLRYRKCSFGNNTYSIDRGYAFEQQLHRNTDDFMNHSLAYYKLYEQNGTIPTMIFAPTVVNDGRRMLISSQSMNFLNKRNLTLSNIRGTYENIDFQSFFPNHHVGNIRFSSVLRCNATFPMVMPMVALPTEPQVHLMDAGIRDNQGTKITLEYVKALEDWIKENTSGVVVIQVRDTKRTISDEHSKRTSFTDKFTLPFGNIVKNMIHVQDFDQEEMIKVGSESFGFPIDFLSFNLLEYKHDRISLSWHLTKQEKHKIENAFNSEYNRVSLKRLKELLK